MSVLVQSSCFVSVHCIVLELNASNYFMKNAYSFTNWIVSKNEGVVISGFLTQLNDWIINVANVLFCSMLM